MNTIFEVKYDYQARMGATIGRGKTVCVIAKSVEDALDIAKEHLPHGEESLIIDFISIVRVGELLNQ